MAEDIFGQSLEDLSTEGEELSQGEAEAEPQEIEDSSDGTDDAQDDTPLVSEGEPPADAAAAQKYWQGAYTRSRQKDRERYGKMEEEHTQYQQLLANFYRDDDYAKKVLAQRFPHLASTLQGDSGQSRAKPSDSKATPSSHLTAELAQNLGEYAFIAEAIGPVFERMFQERLAPLERQTAQQTQAQRKAQEQEVLAEMDAKYGDKWEDSYGASMRELDEFLASDRLTHPKYGNKYELYYRLINPTATRAELAREMGEAAKKRTSVSRTERRNVPNIADHVRKSDLSNRDAFNIAAQAALEEHQAG